MAAGNVGSRESAQLSLITGLVMRQPSILARGLYMWTRWETGRCGAGRKISLELIELEPTTAQWRSDISWCYWAMRDSAAAHDADLLWVLKGVPYFDPIRHEPRYQALLKRVGLAPDR